MISSHERPADGSSFRFSDLGGLSVEGVPGSLGGFLAGSSSNVLTGLAISNRLTASRGGQGGITIAPSSSGCGGQKMAAHIRQADALIAEQLPLPARNHAVAEQLLILASDGERTEPPDRKSFVRHSTRLFRAA